MIHDYNGQSEHISDTKYDVAVNPAFLRLSGNFKVFLNPRVLTILLMLVSVGERRYIVYYIKSLSSLSYII